MAYYCSFSDLQNEYSRHYLATGERLQFPEAIASLYKQGKLASEAHNAEVIHNSGKTDHDRFDELADQLCFMVEPDLILSEDVHERDMIPELRDVFVIRHPKYTRPYKHQHDYVEIDYVASGTCKFHFEEELFNLTQGDFCLIAPSSLHDIEITDADCTVFTIMIRKNTLQAAFFTLLGKEDSLALFFRTLLIDKEDPNYLIIKAEDLVRVELMIHDAMLECFSDDDYSNICCINFVHLVFASLLRSNNGSPQFHHYHMGQDFSAILHYIRHNYRDLTLSELAAHFHYSKPHMCTLIKQNTGTSFTDLVRQIRMNRAKEYLLKSELQISDIAEITGYHSSDHFSRVFRNTFGVSPQKYRSMNYEEYQIFAPFETI